MYEYSVVVPQVVFVLLFPPLQLFTAKRLMTCNPLAYRFFPPVWFFSLGACVVSSPKMFTENCTHTIMPGRPSEWVWQCDALSVAVRAGCQASCQVLAVKNVFLNLLLYCLLASCLLLVPLMMVTVQLPKRLANKICKKSIGEYVHDKGIINTFKVYFHFITVAYLPLFCFNNLKVAIV